MYCPNCGKELQSGEQFCTQCGNRAGGAGRRERFAPQRGREMQIPQGLVENFRILKNITAPYFLGILLLLVNVFLLSQELFTLRYSWEENIMFYTMFENAALVEILFYGAYCVAIGKMLLPLLKDKRLEKKDFGWASTVPLLALVWMLAAVILTGKNMANDYYQRFGEYTFVEMDFTSCGWMLIATSLGAALAVGEAQKATPAEEEKAN